MNIRCFQRDCDKVGSKSCSRCREARYCSSEHQQADWSEHKKRCKEVALEEKVAQLELREMLRYQWFHEKPHVSPSTTITLATYQNLKGDFLWSTCFNPLFVAKLMYNGFLPIASSLGNNEHFFLLPKLHKERSALDWPALKFTKGHISQAQGLSVTIDACFDRTADECDKYHVEERHGKSWLYPPLMKAFKTLFQWNGILPVQMHSFEIWSTRRPEGNDDDTKLTVNPRLAAGEIGYSVGGVYTSLTGFMLEKNTGAVQLLSTAILLEQCGFSFWDLGMQMTYKENLGAISIPREELLGRLASVRDIETVLSLTTSIENKMQDDPPTHGLWCTDLLRWKRDALKQASTQEDMLPPEDPLLEKVPSKNQLKKLARKEKRRLRKQESREAKQS